MSGILLIGAGALARDIIDIFGASTFSAAFVDPQFAVPSIAGLPVVTSWEEARRRASHYVLGAADIAYREHARRQAAAASLLPAQALVSPLARVASDARLANGCVIGHFAVIGPAADLEEDTLVMHAAIVAHDATLGAGTLVCAGACINGKVRVGQRCFVGPNAVLAPNIQLGHDSFVAAGAAGFRDAAPHSMLVGNPARITTLPVAPPPVDLPAH